MFAKLKRPLTKEDCEKWMKNKRKNPISDYTLKEDSPILKEVARQCNIILKDNDRKPSPKNKNQMNNVIKHVSESLGIPPVNIINMSNKSQQDSHNTELKLHYPDVNDAKFAEKISQMKEFNIHAVPKYDDILSTDDFNNISNQLCNKFEKSYYQHFVSQYISNRTPYRSILLYHSVGVGKTCSAITLAESFLIPHNMYDEPKIWVILPFALKTNFRDQIFNIDGLPYDLLSNQCTGDTYIKLLNITQESMENKDKLKGHIKKFINSRYKIFTYDAFAKFIDTEYKDKIVKDKVIIIDEVHNIRSTEKDDKIVYTVLKDVLAKGINNRLVLLSATPMYNEPTDILDLLYLLLMNDKRIDIIDKYRSVFENQNTKFNDNILELIKSLSSVYISYLKGINPFTFASKLSPALSGIPVIQNVPNVDPFDKTLSDGELNWHLQIKEGIVPSIIGNRQMDYIQSMRDVNENNIFNSLQPMNIVFDDEIGESGFYTFFSRATETDPLCVKYNKKYMNALLPNADNLGKYSGKLLNICNIIKRSQGIIIIYSRYRWSGILPLAVCLEHMGYTREGTNNILEKADIISDYPKYDGVKTPKYCIISSEDKDIMGSTNIDNLIKTINDPRNKNGELIKIILITPVASEGLSFFNTREIHLIEPWYHFNRAVQIIGRGIRNCRHQMLPLEQKNVTVFMHASIYDNNKRESIDLHAFRISTRKYAQSALVDTIISNNSLDCALMKNINYFPKTLFKLGKIKIQTSQGAFIDYEYGDSDDLEPKCLVKLNHIHNNGFRRDTYKHFIPNVRTLLRNMIIYEIRNNNFYIPIENILQSINYDSKIVYETIKTAIYPNLFIDGYTIVPHENGLHIISIKPIKVNKINISFGEKKEAPVVNQNQNKVIMPSVKLNRDDVNLATVALYSSLDGSTFENMVKQMLESDVLNETQEYIMNCLAIQGVFIKKNELPNFKNKKMFIGYVNIFNVRDDFDVILYNDSEKKYRDANDNEKRDIMKIRRKFPDIPNMTYEKEPWGMFVPKQLKNKNVVLNLFKLFTTGESVGKKTGIDCNSLKKNEHDDIFKELQLKDMDGTKIQNCIMIANALHTRGRLTMLPLYKPIK
jgi:superfamily II DNA or RNA helicase